MFHLKSLLSFQYFFYLSILINIVLTAEIGSRVRDDIHHHHADNIQEESNNNNNGESVRGYYDDGNELYDSAPVHAVATYGTYGGSKFNPLTVIALTVFGVLALLIFLQLLGVQTTFRSSGGGSSSLIPSSLPFSLPFELNFNSEVIPEIMTKVVDWIETTDKKYNNGGKSGRRQKRDLSETPSITEWLKAYRKDPYEYECLRKLACETLGHSSLVANSMKSQLGSKIMSSLKLFFDDGTMLVETIKDVLEDPDKCSYLFTEFVCDDQEKEEENNNNDPKYTNKNQL